MNRIGSQLKLYRIAALAYFGNKCQKCGSTDRLSLHHKDSDPFNNELSNIALLCNDCHWAEHPSRRNVPKGAKAPTTDVIRVSRILMAFAVKNFLGTERGKELNIYSKKDIVDIAAEDFLRKYGILRQ